MNKKFEIDIERLRKVKELGHCLCNLKDKCPCDDFLNKGKCKCGVYKEVEENNKE